MIKINAKSDPRISENFPNDPYSNLCIVTQTQKLNLQQAFLSMDSEYFSMIDPDTREINLQQLKQQPLIKVIHSLYGEQLIVSSISELAEVYPIIIYLGIEDYKKNIEEEVRSRKEILESLEFLEFSYKYSVCFQEVLEIHMKNKLKILEESKNYLQLNKIQNETFNYLVSEFISRYGYTDCKILNNVMENYFNRKNIKAIAYLKNSSLSMLQDVWLKYHHVSAQFTSKSSVLIPHSHQEEVRRKSETLFVRRDQNLDKKRKIIVELQNQLNYKENTISELNLQIQEIKRELGIKSEKPITARSLIFDMDREYTTPHTRKIKRIDELLPQILSDDDTNLEQKTGNQGKKVTTQPKDLNVLAGFSSKNIKKC